MAAIAPTLAALLKIEIPSNSGWVDFGRSD
jgi:hypothetical protein